MPEEQTETTTLDVVNWLNANTERVVIVDGNSKVTELIHAIYQQQDDAILLRNADVK